MLCPRNATTALGYTTRESRQQLPVASHLLPQRAATQAITQRCCSWTRNCQWTPIAPSQGRTPPVGLEQPVKCTAGRLLGEKPDDVERGLQEAGFLAAQDERAQQYLEG
jgi:hypothetical protein